MYKRVIVSSVFPPADSLLRQHTTPIFIRYDTIPILTLDVHYPEQVGSDRLVNALAAHMLVHTSALIIDSGTALTCCYVSKEGVYKGGTIFPGMRIASQALNDYTAKIPLIYVSKQASILGKDTKEAVQNGLYYGYIAMINSFIKYYKALDPTLTIIGTGKGLEILADQLAIDRYEPYLIMDGLAICAKS